MIFSTEREIFASAFLNVKCFLSKDCSFRLFGKFRSSRYVDQDRIDIPTTVNCSPYLPHIHVTATLTTIASPILLTRNIAPSTLDGKQEGRFVKRFLRIAIYAAGHTCHPLSSTPHGSPFLLPHPYPSPESYLPSGWWIACVRLRWMSCRR